MAHLWLVQEKGRRVPWLSQRRVRGPPPIALWTSFSAASTRFACTRLRLISLRPPVDRIPCLGTQDNGSDQGVDVVREFEGVHAPMVREHDDRHLVTGVADQGTAEPLPLQR